jgi:DnaJ-domain-containing protein 1
LRIDPGMIDYYEVLEISPNASDEILKKAYYRLVQKYHPDRFHSSNKEYATRRNRLLQEAYHILSDPMQRRRYDIRLAEKTRIHEDKAPSYMMTSLRLGGFILLGYVIARIMGFSLKMYPMALLLKFFLPLLVIALLIWVASKQLPKLTGRP